MANNRLLDPQIGFYYGNKISSDKSIYNIAEYVEINHPLDITRMKQAIYWVISQTPTLHVLFAEDNGVPYQRTATCSVMVELVDLSHRADSMAVAFKLIEEDARLPFSLDAPPLFRQKILTLGENRFLWYFCSHHLLLDGYSAYLLIHRVAETYRNQPLTTQRFSQTPTLDELLKAESKYKNSADYQADKQFWQNTCSQLPVPTTLARTNMPSGLVIRHAESFLCSASLFSLQINQPSWLARTIAAVMVYLYFGTGENAQVIGVPMMSRTDPLSRQALTCKTNVLPLALDIEETSTGLQLAHDIERKLKQLKKHQSFRYEEIKSLRGNASHSPLFNIVVNIIPFEAAASFSPKQRSLVRNIRSGNAQDLVFNLRPDIDSQTLRLEIDADSGLYDRASLARHSLAVQKLSSLLNSEQENAPIQQLRRHFVLSLCGKKRDCDVVDVMQRIERTVAHAPQSLAICTPEHPSKSLRELCYALLQQHVRSWANLLAPARTMNTALLIDLPKGPEAVILMLASLQLNMPFVNLNSSANEAEYHRLLEQFDDAILITVRTFKRHSLLRASFHWQSLVLAIPKDYTHCTLLRRRMPVNNAEFPAGIGYIMFTSGTTGVPKGVICGRRALNVFISAAIERYGICSHDRVLQFAPLHFDASIEEIFMTLAVGASLYVAPDASAHSFPDLLEFCATHHLSLLDLPTAYFNEMLFALGGKLQMPATVTTVIVGGESLSARSKELWFSKHSGHRRLINSYGPTEATVVATAAEVKNDDGPITIGSPLNGIFTAIVGENLAPVPLGCSGELLIAGDTVSMGYLNQPALSAKKFVTIEINGHQLPAFRTGDIASMDHDRQLLFLGRKVRETKIAGQRVNMSEIEACITKLPGVVEVAVLAKSGNVGAVLYAHYHSPQPLDELTRRALFGKLPNSHIPKCFVHHQTPLVKLSNGKIDYRTLEQHSQEATPKYELCSTTFKTLVREIWLTTLGSDDGDFFTLGGESLQGIKIINALNTHCQFDLNLRDIFEHPNLTDFCQHLVHLAYTRYGLTQHHLDIRCAVIRYPSAESNMGVKSHYLVNRYAGQYLWLYENFKKNSSMYNIPIAKEIIGTFEPARLISGLRKLLQRHPALCGHYRLDGDNITVDISVPDTTIFERCLEDISVLNQEKQQNSVMAALGAQCNIPFDLGSELPLRCQILRKNAQHHYLFLTFHHCVVDGWTANLLVDELSRDYHSEGGSPPHDDGHAFYRFIEDPFVAIANVDDSLEFWLDELRDAPEKHSLDYDIAIAAADKEQNIVRDSLAGDLQQALTQQAKFAGTSLFALLHTAFALLIARESASERVVIGSPVANRTEPALNAAVGSFVNTVAHQFNIATDDNFSTLLQKSAGKFAHAFKHQGLPFSYLVEQLKPARGKFHPIFQIMFVCQHRKSNELIFGSAQVDTLSRNYAPPKFDLVLEVISTVDGIQFEWQYNARLFAPQRIKALSQAYALLLEQIACDPMQAIGLYSLTPTADIAQLRKLSTGAKMPEFLQQNLSQRLWCAANEHTALPALIEGEHVWSYDELLHHAGTVSHWLEAHTVQKALIAIDLPRGALQAIVALGILLAGRAYLPLAEGLPDARAADVIRLSGCDWVINTAAHRHNRYPLGTHCQDLEAIFSAPHLRDDFHFTPGKSHDLAYVIYTSGTTGTPKGVAIEHGAITNTLLAMNQLFHVSSQDNILAIADLAFDLSVYDLFGSWLAGATVICLSTDDAKEPASWLNAIRQRQISIWNSVPAILQMLVNYCEQANIASLPELRQIWLSGDRISPQLIAQAHRLCPNASITSLGGATEGAIWSIYHPLARDTQYRNAIPYGVALPNQSIWVLDDNLKPCSYGATGDIYIGGAGVAREYWRDRQTTSGSFLTCAKLGGRLYRTGDRGRWSRCDYIEFLGREDQQVKLQGFRVELGDVEFVLKSNALVAEACVVCCNDPESGIRHLEAYIALTPEGKSNAQVEDQLREHVATALPAYMTPTRYHVIEHFPLSRNGKLDRSLLSSHGTLLQAQLGSISPTITAELQHLQRLLAETLGCESNQINPHASFFANGGSSLSGITFLGKIKRALNVELTLAEILGYQRLTSLAERIRQNYPLALSTLSGSVNRPSLPTLYLVHGAGGQVHQYARLIQKLSPFANIRTIASPGLEVSGESFSMSMKQLATAHLAAIPQDERASAVIAGWSLGGQLAIHMAALATQQGKPFAHAVVIDSGLPSSIPLKKRPFSVAQCYLSLFDSLGITRHLYRHKERDSKNHFIDEVRECYAFNEPILAEKIAFEHAKAFCLAIKQSLKLTHSAGDLPQLDIPLTLWLNQARLRKQPNLTQRWKAQSSHNVRLTYCEETHYGILDNARLQQELIILLNSLPVPAEQDR